MPNMSNKILIGITGQTGGGKSTVRRYVESLGFMTFDADKCVEYLYEYDQTLIAQMVALMGDVLNATQSVDKAKVYSVLQDDASMKPRLEALVHPRVKDCLLEFYNRYEGVLFAEVPLLFESNWEALFDEVWCVLADINRIARRLKMYRKWDERRIETMLTWRNSLENKCAQADYILYNNSSVYALKKQVLAHCQRLEKELL